MGRRLDQLDDITSGGIQDTDYVVGYRPGALGIRITAAGLASYFQGYIGANDHGLLNGILDDDHPQYHNDARGDARYLRRANNLSDLNSASAARTNLGLGSVPNVDTRQRSNHTGTQLAATISDFTSAVIAASPVTSVAGRTGPITLTNADISGLGGSAVLDVGTTAGTVAAGDDSRFMTVSGGVPRFTSFDLAKPGGGYVRVTANDDGTLNFDQVA